MHLPRYTETTTAEGTRLIEVECIHVGCRYTASVVDSETAQDEVEAAFAEHQEEPSAAAEPRTADVPIEAASLLPDVPAAVPRSTWKTLLAVVPLTAAILVGGGVAALQQDRDGAPRASSSDDADGGTGLESGHYADRQDTADPEVADNGPDLYSAASFDSYQRNMFLYTARELDDFYETQSDDDLVGLGAEICESLSNGNPKESVIKVLVYLSDWEPMTVARLVSSADEYLC